MKKVAYAGIDYHLNSLTIALMVEGERDILNTIRIKNDDKLIKRYMKKLFKNYKIKACYEASCNGYSFQSKMKSWGYDCDVIAPSLIPKKAGCKRKNDFRDSIDLAKNYAGGLLTIVVPPTKRQESVRALIRCRLELKNNEKSVKMQINSLMQSQNLRWTEGKKRWTVKHLLWLSKIEMQNHYLQQVLNEFLGHLNYLSTRVAYLDSQIEEIANTDIYAESVKNLKALKGIDILSAMILIAEITDFRRFSSPRALMAYLGLIPSENSSGDKQQGGPITKTGNKRCRTQLIESVQSYVKKPNITYNFKQKLKEVDAKRANLSIKCMHRLHNRFWALTLKGKSRNVAITAVAREFVGFIWAMMQPQDNEQGGSTEIAQAA